MIKLSSLVKVLLLAIGSSMILNIGCSMNMNAKEEDEARAIEACDLLRKHLADSYTDKGSEQKEALDLLGDKVEKLPSESPDSSLFGCGKWTFVVKEDIIEGFLDLPGNRLYSVKVVEEKNKLKIVDLGVELFEPDDVFEF